MLLSLRVIIPKYQMKAIIHTKYGSSDVLQLKEVERPLPEDNEVLIKVQAVSVNRSDWEGLTGTPLYARFGGILRPRRKILGSDIAGRVEMIGRNVSRFQLGMRSSETLRFVWVVLLSMSALLKKP